MRQVKVKVYLMAVLMAMMVISFGVTDAFAYSVKQVWARFQGTAGEALVIGDAVCIKDSDGYVYKADANDSALRPAIGVAGIRAASGAKVEVIVHGVLRGWTALSEGAAAYLSETAGAITQAAPAWSQQLGFAISKTEYLINARAYLDTSALTALGVLTGATPLIFEGATADAYETTIAVTDPTADRTITLPDATGTVSITGTGGGIGHDYAGGHADWTLTAVEAEATYIATTNAAGGGANALLASCRAGKQYYVDNSSGQTVTFKVAGQTGAAVATGKMAIYVCTGTDVKQIYTQP